MSQDVIGTLQEQLTQTRHDILNTWESGERSYYNAFEDDLLESDIKHHHLRQGDAMPSFTLPDHQGVERHSKDLLSDGWLVLTFYRGQWCPFCNMQLRALERSLQSIRKIPATLVAVSPELPDHAWDSVQKNALSFPVLSDIGNKVGRQFNIVYKIPPYLHHLYNKYGIHIEHYNGEGELYLPMPATFVIDQQGIVRMASVNAHAHERPDPGEVVKFLKEATH
mgnify:CR=1 FL=1